ncbi:Mlp lipoprotein family protein (plasmid) [Borrelia nietonii YOR]|uniref:Mlp lipoprotein family protein n=1 Tax=Borrelia nietonii YOR TaxID=1293576 RepID=W5SBE6_9SPIR|nr:Mlp family lipoprotein [Borrelia nietonii]AHH04277.1 Mlp lipoprotein family protein [Borrelia nietonii YOR]UPA10004.1 Mlp family lipoprotein [Borrelia nietonii YOR]UPA10057.1 Mlp family lipoprotein [Borrelia nietonii YOR]
MSKINFVLVLLLLISSCGQDTNKDKGIKSRSKRDDLREQAQEVQKTPEEALRDKLSDNQKQGLNFLKGALGDDNDFKKFLSFDESKIKFALDHIQSELAKCTGDNASQQKETFKQIVKGSFEGNSNDLDKFKEQASSTCGTGG